MTDREVDVLKMIIEILQKHLKPSRIILFGSRGKESNSQNADFDLAVDCPKPQFSVQRKINEEIEDVSGLYLVDIVYLPSIDEEFKEIILKTGKVIYETRDQICS